MANYDSQYDPTMVKMRNKEEGEAFACIRPHILKGEPSGWKLFAMFKTPCLTLLIPNVYVPGSSFGT